MKASQWKLGVSRICAEEGPIMSADLPSRFRAAGIECVETGVRWEWNAKTYPSNAERLRRIIGSYQDGGLTVWSVHLPGGRTIDISHPDYANAGIELARKQLDVLAQMGVGRAVLHPSFEPIADADRPARMRRCAESVRALLHADVCIAIENLPRTCLGNAAEEMCALLDMIGPMARACVDVNHSHRGDIAGVLRAVGSRLATVHISDDDGVDEKHWYPTQGVLNWVNILRTLEDIGYDGCFMYELKGPDVEPERIRENFDTLLEMRRLAH